MGVEIFKSEDIHDNLAELISLIQEKNQNIGTITIIFTTQIDFVKNGHIARLQIHFRYDDDPITEIPEEFVNDDGSVSPSVEDFYSNYNRMIPYDIFIDDGVIDFDKHVEEITRRVTRYTSIQNVQ